MRYRCGTSVLRFGDLVVQPGDVFDHQLPERQEAALLAAGAIVVEPEASAVVVTDQPAGATGDAHKES